LPVGERIRVSPLGESGLELSWPQRDVVETAAVVAAAWRRLRDAGLRGVVDVVPAPARLLVLFNPAVTSRRELAAAVSEIATVARPGSARPMRRPRRVPVVYGGEAGPDLESVAARLGLDADTVVRIHAAATYTVLATGFSPGFVYLGPLDARLVLPRRGRPLASIPAGSVAIAANQTGIYGLGGAGGWWIIGRTSARTFSARRDPPALLAQGDRVRFSVMSS
jgi:KipI family sensor histidine kinase inhibitor